MNKELYDQKITDVTLRGEDIRAIARNIEGETVIVTRDKAYCLPDEEAEVYNTLRDYSESNKRPDDKAKFPSIKLMGEIHYRNLEQTKFSILEEPVADKARVKVAWSNSKIGNYKIIWHHKGSLLAMAYYLLAVSEHSAIERLRSEIADKGVGEELIIIDSVELISDSNSVPLTPKWERDDRELRRLMSEIILKGPGQSVSDLIAEFERVRKQFKPCDCSPWDPRCDCGKYGSKESANNDPFNVRPW